MATGWGSLYAILSDVAADAAWERERLQTPIQCPLHKVPLDTGPRGEPHCTPGGHIVKEKA